MLPSGPALAARQPAKSMSTNLENQEPGTIPSASGRFFDGLHLDIGFCIVPASSNANLARLLRSKDIRS